MSRTEYVVNYVDKPLRQFQPGDTLYIRKIINGFAEIYYCEFIGIVRGIIGAKIIDVMTEDRRYNTYKVGQEITTKSLNIFLWGATEQLVNYRCYWFEDLDNPAR
jgi:hypothetical protein